MSQDALLGPLVDAIESVKQRIQEHGASLRENETRTRVALIDPILQALGWDVSDPASVTLEYDVQGRRADYALLRANNRPAATIEAKKLGENLQQHRMQMLNYANASGVDYAGLTDGNHWELYDVFKRGELSERELLSVTIADSASHESALKLLLLWRLNLEAGQPVEAATPIAGLPEISAESQAIVDSTAVQVLPATNPTSGEVALADFVPVPGSKPPIRIRFPDGSIRRLTYWKAILVESIEWAFASDESKVHDSPIDYGHGGLINNQPLQKSGKRMASPYEIKSKNLFVETHGSAATIVARCKAILRELEVDSARVLLYLEE